MRTLNTVEFLPPTYPMLLAKICSAQEYIKQKRIDNAAAIKQAREDNDAEYAAKNFIYRWLIPRSMFSADEDDSVLTYDERILNNEMARLRNALHLAPSLIRVDTDTCYGIIKCANSWDAAVK